MPPQAAQASPLIQFLPIIFIFGIFYFLLIRPQRQQEREHRKMISALAKNDEIVTSGGIHGTIVNVKEKTVVVRVDDNVKIEIDRSAVAYKKETKTENQGN